MNAARTSKFQQRDLTAHLTFDDQGPEEKSREVENAKRRGALHMHPAWAIMHSHAVQLGWPVRFEADLYIHDRGVLARSAARDVDRKLPDGRTVVRSAEVDVVNPPWFGNRLEGDGSMISVGDRVRVKITNHHEWASGAANVLEGATGKVEEIQTTHWNGRETLHVPPRYLVRFDEPLRHWHNNPSPIAAFHFDACDLTLAFACMCGAIDPPRPIGDDGNERCLYCGCH